MFYKHSRIKQYLKEGRALRVETVVNQPNDLGCQRRAGRGLVVESGQHQALVAGLDQQPRQDRDTRTDRQAARCPGNGICQRIALDAELHVSQASASFR